MSNFVGIIALILSLFVLVDGALMYRYAHSKKENEDCDPCPTCPECPESSDDNDTCPACTCPMPTNTYVIEKNTGFMTSSATDKAYSGFDIDHLKLICDQMGDACVGFTDQGMVHGSLAGKHQSADIPTDFYRKQGPAQQAS